MINFNNKIYLLGLLIIPVLLIVYELILNKKKKQAMKFSNLSFIKSAMGNKKSMNREKVLFYLSLFILFLFILAFSDPTIPLKQTKKGVNVVLVMDISGSMQATDYKPNRIEAAKNSAEILLKSLQPNDEAGIVVFESGATTAAYLSPFKDKVIQKLKNIKAHQGRTAIGDGLSLGIDMATSIPNKKKVIILLSDGVNNAGVISPDEAIQFAKANKIQVYTIGLGSNKKVVLGYDWFGNPQYAKLDEKTLKKIAEDTGGKYFRSVDDKTLKEIYKNISKDIKREKEDVSIKNEIFVFTFFMYLIYLYLRYGNKMIIQ